MTIEETGDITASKARDRQVSNDLQRAEILSVPVTLVVLLFAFGAVVAALVPLLLVLTAVAAAFGLLGPISQAIPIDDSVRTVLVLIGMAVGVDYALFYVMRSREERRRGQPPHEALERTIRTSGRTVILSGSTVIAMAAMFLIGTKVFNSLAAATISVVACAVAGSVTVVPGVLELLGKRIDRGRIPFLPHLRTDQTHSRFWTAVIDRVLKRPARVRALCRRPRCTRDSCARAEGRFAERRLSLAADIPELRARGRKSKHPRRATRSRYRPPRARSL